MNSYLDRIHRTLASRQPRVVVVGDLMLDRSFSGQCERVSPEAPVPVVVVKDETLTLGGAGNVAANLMALGAWVELAGAIGGDADADVLRSLLEGSGASTSGLVTDPKRSTTTKTRVVAGNQQVVRYDVETLLPLDDALAEPLVNAIEASLADCAVLVLSDYGKGVLTPNVCSRLIDAARRANVTVLCDPKGRDFSKYSGATVVTPNRREVAEVAGESVDQDADLRRIGAQLRERYGLENLLVTLGGDGMLLIDESSAEHIATTASEVFDVTGAGDTAIATMAFGISCGLSVSQASRLANIAAGIAVSRVGTATVTLVDLDLVPKVFSERPSETPRVKKVLERHEVKSRCEQLRQAGGVVVFTNGCFDVLHAGHIALLERASQFGDLLVVGLNSDASVSRLKPGRPINHEADRLCVLSALGCVDVVTTFEEDTPRQLIEDLRPDVLVKGGDYPLDEIVGARFVQSLGGSVQTVPLVKDRSTTAIAARIAAFDAESLRTEGQA